MVRKSRNAMWILGGAFVVAVCCYSQSGDKVDLSKPFSIEFGRGSGMFGLDTVKIDQSGRACVHRLKQEQPPGRGPMAWETTTLQLTPDAVAGLLRWIDANDLMALDKQYRANIHDGTQWVLWIRQGEKEKSTYFNNSFSAKITRFAEQIDDTMARAGLEQATWQTVPESEARQHERPLWDSIRR